MFIQESIFDTESYQNRSEQYQRARSARKLCLGARFFRARRKINHRALTSVLFCVLTVVKKKDFAKKKNLLNLIHAKNLMILKSLNSIHTKKSFSKKAIR